MLKLDIRTLAILMSFIGVIIGLTMITVYRTRKTYPGFIWWVWSAFLLMSGMLLSGLRAVLPDCISTHSEAQSSCAICAGCLTELYPEPDAQQPDIRRTAA